MGELVEALRGPAEKPRSWRWLVAGVVITILLLVGAGAVDALFMMRPVADAPAHPPEVDASGAAHERGTPGTPQIRSAP